MRLMSDEKYQKGEEKGRLRLEHVLKRFPFTPHFCVCRHARTRAWHAARLNVIGVEIL